MEKKKSTLLDPHFMCVVVTVIVNHFMTEKLVFTQKQMILTSEQLAEHHLLVKVHSRSILVSIFRNGGLAFLKV